MIRHNWLQTDSPEGSSVIRFINCMKRKPELSPEQFRQYWNDPKFSALTDRMVALTGAIRCVRSTTLNVEANQLIKERRGGQDPFDGVLEYWWENAGSLLDKVNSPEGEALIQEMMAYQHQFVDFANSTAFFTEA